jgi:hypothetical protein
LWAAVVARRLEEVATPVFTRRQPLTSADTSTIRLAALALAGEESGSQLPQLAEAREKFRAIAAAVTLLERRAAGQAPLETLILARA